MISYGFQISRTHKNLILFPHVLVSFFASIVKILHNIINIISLFFGKVLSKVVKKKNNDGRGSIKNEVSIVSYTD